MTFEFHEDDHGNAKTRRFDRLRGAALIEEVPTSVAVWVGNLENAEEVIEAYALKEDENYDPLQDEAMNLFSVDMDDYAFDLDLLGVHIQDKPTDLESLISEIDGSDLFLMDSVESAESLGVLEGNVVLALFRHELKEVNWPPTSPVTFLGNFRFS